MMMSPASDQKLRECSQKLRDIVLRVSQYYPVIVMTGHRDEATQNKAFREKRSKLKYPNSKHNRFPSDAIDIAPMPLDFTDHARFYYLAGLMMATAHDMGVKLRWGGDWDSDNQIKDEKFLDLSHFELVE